MSSCFIKSFIVFLFFLVFVGCSDNNRKENSMDVITVGNRSLTLNELKKHFSESSYDSTKIFNHISGWVEKELLYQAGISQGLDLDGSIIQKILEYERKMVGEGFLELNKKNISIDTVLIKEYYNSKNTLFIRKDKEVEVFYVTVDDRPAALKIKKEIRNKSKEKLSHTFSKYGGVQQRKF